MREVRTENKSRLDRYNLEIALDKMPDFRAQTEMTDKYDLETDLDKMPQFKVDTERTDND